jgi:predicted phage terminase large subunit-like protein
VLTAQSGPQAEFVGRSITHDAPKILLFGGAFGGGKSYALLLIAAYWSNVPAWSCVIFRRTSVELRGPGSLWEASYEVFPHVGGKPFESRLEWRFPSGASVKFSHLQHESDIHSMQGRQIACVMFDELTHFTPKQFWYLFGRNRSPAAAPSIIRATCNPDPTSFVRPLLDWYIKDGYPDPERAGKTRYFVRKGEQIQWGNTSAEFTDRDRRAKPISFAFIPSKLTDNKILLGKDPDYLAALESLPEVERLRNLEGNWDVQPTGGLFDRVHFELVDAPPWKPDRVVRAWDLAASRPSDANPDPDWTVGLRLSRAKGVYYIEHVCRFRENPMAVEQRIRAYAAQDRCQIAVWRDPGQAGKVQIEHLKEILFGFHLTETAALRDKLTYARPFASLAEQGRVKVIRAPWNECFFAELEGFPSERGHDDQVDAASLAFQTLGPAGIRYTPAALQHLSRIT